jgi:predicted lipid-binding transport protein (Tim44 family)
MGESIPFGDLIVLGAIALFIILRYRSVLGQKTGHDFSKNPSAKSEKETLQIVTPEKKAVDLTDSDHEIPHFDDPQVASAIDKMKSIDPTFTIQSFISGAKMAFEMVIDGFNKHDRETLEMLLAPEVYESFEANLKEQEEKQYKSETTLIAMKEAEIVGAELKKNVAQITVQFLTEQVHVMRDKDKKVVEGDASIVQDIADEWTFERDLKSRNPNWNIIAT